MVNVKSIITFISQREELLTAASHDIKKKVYERNYSTYCLIQTRYITV